MIHKNNIINPNNIKLLIFDIDGTIVEYRTLKDLFKKALSFYNVPFKEEYFSLQGQAVGELLIRSESERIFNFDNMIKFWTKYLVILKEYDIDPKEFSELMIFLEPEFTYIMDGVYETLETLNNLGYNIVVATNWFEFSQRRKLEKFDLNKFFERIYTCENEFSKPNKQHFNRIIDDYKVDPSKTLVIGDSSADIKASLYGINTILVDYYKKHEDLYGISTSVVSEFPDIMRVLKI